MTVSTAQNMIPTAFWNALNNQNFEDLNTPQWSIVVNDAGIQCSIFFENQVQSGYILKNVLKGRYTQISIFTITNTSS